MTCVEANKNILEKIGREEGFKNPEDIYDIDYITTAEEIGSVASDVDIRLVSEHAPETQVLIGEVKQFGVELSETYKQEFLKILEVYRAERRAISDKIVAFLEKKGFSMPRITVADHAHAAEIFSHLGFPRKHIAEDSLLIVLNLPKPLSYFWWKGGEDWGDVLAKQVGPSVIEWGYFYRTLMPVIWERVGYYETERDLRFDRINHVGEHDPEKFYYIWEVSRS